jgi:acetolactate synthase-1/2/3 large subunit
MGNNRPTCAERLLSLSKRLGADYIFTNLGSDHPAFIEAFATLRAEGAPMPAVITCPHEMTTLSAAHGYAMVTRKPQLVLVHVDVGTQNLGGSVHNAARGRVPAIVVAGLSPVTENAGIRGGRNEFIHDLQDAPRQAAIVDQYMKWTYEVRAAESIDAIVLRAFQLSTSEPAGPIYLSGAREVWEASVPDSGESPSDWPAPELGGLPLGAVGEIAAALVESRRPLVVTGYLGRKPEAVERLVALSERVGIGVCEVSPVYMNFPGDHPHHLGYRRNTLIDAADLLLLVDVDVPWLKSKVRPAPNARIFHVDIDPVKEGIGFWHYPARRACRADALQALDQLLAAVGRLPAGREERECWIAESRRAVDPAPVPRPGDGPITPDELSSAVRELVNEKTRVVFEAPTATELIPAILKLSRPGSYFNSGGTGLGWGVNAAIGLKLASPDSEVIALVGDGCYQFAVPTSAYWVASTYDTPFLTVIYNNGGWNAPRFSTLGVHPDGVACREDTYFTTMTAGARLADMAQASGAVDGFTVRDRSELCSALHQAMRSVRGGRCAVVDVAITPFSKQVLKRG